MYVRNAKDRDEPWLIDLFTDAALEITAFRRDEFVVAVDETTTTRLGAGRVQFHDETGIHELTGLVVLPETRGQGVGAHLIERALARVTDAGGDQLYLHTEQPQYFAQFGFRGVERVAAPDVVSQPADEAIVMTVEPTAFQMPDRLRQRFKRLQVDDGATETETTAEEFDATAEDATYKYEL